MMPEARVAPSRPPTTAPTGRMIREPASHSTVPPTTASSAIARGRPGRFARDSHAPAKDAADPSAEPSGLLRARMGSKGLIVKVFQDRIWASLGRIPHSECRPESTGTSADSSQSPRSANFAIVLSIAPSGIRDLGGVVSGWGGGFDVGWRWIDKGRWAQSLWETGRCGLRMDEGERPVRRGFPLTVWANGQKPS